MKNTKGLYTDSKIAMFFMVFIVLMFVLCFIFTPKTQIKDNSYPFIFKCELYNDSAKELQKCKDEASQMGDWVITDIYTHWKEGYSVVVFKVK